MNTLKSVLMAVYNVIIYQEVEYRIRRFYMPHFKLTPFKSTEIGKKKKSKFLWERR